MLVLIIIMIFTCVFTIYYCILSFAYRRNIIISTRLNRIGKDIIKDDDLLNQSLFVRVAKPMLDSVSKAILKITPKEIVASFERKVIMAGNPYKLSIKDWINIQVIITICLPLITAFVAYYKGMGRREFLMVCMLEIYIGLALPNLALGKSISKRKKQITNTLPDVIDLLTVSVEAGLGFDSAVARVVEKMPGPLALEFSKALQEVKVGRGRKEALRDMAERVAVQDLTTFVGSILQGEQLGVSIGNVLRVQSEHMRLRRKQRAQEKAMKAPVKMIIPMILFIFPTIFSVLIGPIIIKVIEIMAP